MTRSETLSGPSSLVSENLETSSLKDEVSEENENTVWVAVIGAGIAGLAAALHLLDLSDQQDKKVNVIVFEASDRVGGRIWTHEKGMTCKGSSILSVGFTALSQISIIYFQSTECFLYASQRKKS
jgi:ribulose 1,5-bisphosphate synthetase/thiazole synthase